MYTGTLKLKKATLSVIIPAYNAANTIGACLEALVASSVQPHECIVVDDGSTDGTAAVARRFGARVIRTGGNRGAAAARNAGAAASAGEILVFIDADVCVQPDTLERIRRHFDKDPALDAVFGCYDDSPQAPDFLSQYRNLMHRYVHRRGRREASTFWTGCGAVRRHVFEAAGGFDASLAGMEDIDLGYRLRRLGRRILLDHDLEVQHRKQWRFWNMIRTDLLLRGAPWVELILRYRFLPNDLNVGASQRVSLLAVLLFLAAAAWGVAAEPVPATLALGTFFFALLGTYWSEFLTTWKGAAGPTLAAAVLGAGGLYSGMPWPAASVAVLWPGWPVLGRFRRHPAAAVALGLLTAACAGAAAAAFAAAAPAAAAVAGGLLAAVIVVNRSFYSYLARRRGLLFAAGALPFQILYYSSNALALVLGALRYLTRSARPEPAVLVQRQSSSD